MAFCMLERGHREGMRVLIVDDDETTCRLLAKVLTQSGLNAVWTTDSRAGYALALRFAYDLCVVDVGMPVLSGTAFAEGLKKARPSAKILLISAFADEALRREATRLGVSLLSKPFTPEDLLQAVTRLLGRRA